MYVENGPDNEQKFDSFIDMIGKRKFKEELYKNLIKITQSLLIVIAEYTEYRNKIFDPREALAFEVDHNIWWWCPSVLPSVCNASKVHYAGIWEK